MKVVWDEIKRRQNLAKHGLDFADLDLAFFAAAKLTPARAGRFGAVGEFNDRFTATVIFQPLGSEAIAIISFRVASRKERRS